MIEFRTNGTRMDASKMFSTPPGQGVWAEITHPTKEDITKISDLFDIPETILEASLDNNERPRVHATDAYTLIILDTPHVERGLKNTLVFQTYPLVVISTKSGALVTVTNHNIDFMERFHDGFSRDFMGQPEPFFPCGSAEAILQIVHAVADSFINALTRIDDISASVEKDLHKSMHNKQLIEMLSINKSLVYLFTSLKSNRDAIKGLSRLPDFSSSPENEKLAETQVEVEQALEMAEIYRNVLSSTMGVFSSIISNNLNDVMKILTSATIIITIPMLFAGLWGMNVPVPWARHPQGFFIVLGISFVSSILFAWWLHRRDYF